LFDKAACINSIFSNGIFFKFFFASFRQSLLASTANILWNLFTLLKAKAPTFKPKSNAIPLLSLKIKQLFLHSQKKAKV
jgi:hypothetical protein